MKRVLVTGANGFISGHLINRLLAGGVAVRGLVHERAERLRTVTGVEIVRGDLGDLDAMRAAAAGTDTVLHLAGRVHALSEVRGDESLYNAVNVEGTRNVLEAALEGGVRRVLFFSSVQAMGTGGPDCLDEAASVRPTTAYGRSKLAAEELVLDYGRRHDLYVACLRLPAVYGPHNKGNLHRMIAAIDRGMFPPLPDTGNRRSIVHVANVVEAALLALASPAANGQRYIVTDARAYSTRELHERLCRALGRRVPRWSVPLALLRAAGRAGDVVGRLRGKRFVFDSDVLEKLIGSAWYSSEKIARELGYRPVIGLEEALPGLVTWYRSATRTAR